VAASDKLQLAIQVFKALDRSPGSGERVVGRVPPGFDFEEISNELEAAELLVDSDAASRRIEFRLPSFFFLSLNHLLAGPSRRTRVPARFYLADLDYLHCSDSTNSAPEPSQVAQYRAAVHVFDLLASLADHTSEFAGELSLVFLGKSKLIVDSVYGSKDLTDLGDLDKFGLEFIESETHAKQKRTIARTALLELFEGQPSVSLGNLLSAFHKLHLRIIASYELYVAEFSFEKVRAAVEKEKLEFTTKLNKTFSDIQTQLLAVPAALILIGGQLEKTGTWSVKNSLIWLGAVVFALLMDLLIRNQRNTLAAVKAEIDEQRRQIEGEYQSVAFRFTEAYRQLDRRHRHQQRLIATVSSLVAVALSAASWLFVSYSNPPEVGDFALGVATVVLGVGWLALIGRWAHALYRSKRAHIRPHRAAK
jgi:hypothetical protein